MHNGLQQAQSVILIGADCPSIDQSYIDGALELLAGTKQVVIGPAEDGGYVLLGLSGNFLPLFEDIPWGTDQVLARTLEKLTIQGLDYSVLGERWDVDRAEDLDRLNDLDPPLEYSVESV